MSILAVIIVILFGAILAGTFYVAFQNQVALQSSIVFYGEHELAVWAVILGAFFAGFALAFALAAFRSSQLALGRLRNVRDTRQRERVERLYAEGLQAVLAEKPDRAEDRFREVLARMSDHTDTLMAYGEVLRGKGRAREAADLHRRASEAKPGDMRPLFALAADWRADGDVDNARLTLERVIASNPKESLRARRELRELLIADAQWQEARRVHGKIEAEAKDDDERARERRVGLGIGYELAQAAEAAGSLKDAEREYRALVKAEPTFVPASLALGQVLLAAGHEKDAVREWRRGFEATQSPVFLTRLETHYFEKEQPKELLGLIHELIDSSSSAAVPTFFLGKLYLRLEMVDEAESTFASLEDEAPEARVLKFYAAKLLERRDRHRDASEAYRKVIRESGLLDVEYRCRACGVEAQGFTARCGGCGEWGTVDVDPHNALTTADLKGTLVPKTDWAATP